MLAPMQGVTNRAVREVFSALVRPDVLFTEFVRVSGNERARIGSSDRREIANGQQGPPLVVQLIGGTREALVAAARQAGGAGATHLNLNLGCPYGRMTTGLTGGKLLQRPDLIAELLPALRAEVAGSLSVKLRAGYDDDTTVFDLLPVFEAAGVDFLVLHPRTVVQKYAGDADHRITRAVVGRTRLPVIANGDIRTAADGHRVLAETGAAGLMLGRGAIADPWLFARLRGQASADPDRQERLAQLRSFLTEVACRYDRLFCGEKQVLTKLKGLLTAMEEPQLLSRLAQLKKSKTRAEFDRRLRELD